MKHASNLSLALAGALALGIAGCSDGTTADGANALSDNDMMANMDDVSANAASASADSHAAQFLTDAMKGDNSEVKLGTLAAEHGDSQGVKDFGAMLKSDHGKAKQKVAALATSLGVPVTDEVKPDADVEYAKLQGMSGADFDKEFVSYMIDEHKKDIAKFQQEAGSNDPQSVTELASETVPTLQMHLEKAQSLQ